MNATQLSVLLLLFLGVYAMEGTPKANHAYKSPALTFEMERLQFVYREYFRNRRGRRQRLKDRRRGLCA